MSFYLDTSILVPIWVPEAGTEAVEEWLESDPGELVISDLADPEFRAGIARLVRTGDFGQAQAFELNLRFDAWREAVADPVENLPVDIRRAAQLVRSPFPKLLTPDAIHIATCQRLALTLVSHDHDMVTVAKREGMTALSPG